MSVMLSPHFSLAGMVATSHRALVEENARYANAHAGNLKRLCVALLEPAREILGGHPMIITSGIRCPALNTAVGSGPGSAHLAGLAADFICPGFGSPYDVCVKLAEELPARGVAFDQLIYEFGRWIHLAVARPNTGEQRGQVLSIHDSVSGYLPGIVLKSASQN